MSDGDGTQAERSLGAGNSRYTLTVPGPASEDAATPLAARIHGFPAEHDGQPFEVRVAFSEEIENSYTHVYLAAGGTTGAEVTASRRHEGKSDLWFFRVEPSGHGAVAFKLRGGGTCAGRKSAVLCTEGGAKVLSNSLAIEILGQAAISVADAEATEGTDAHMAFTVSLDRAALKTITVDYETRDGTATAGEDYTATEGTLSFTVGQRSKTVRVPILDDAHDDGGETFDLVLSNPSGARIEDGAATGTIRNSDAMPGLYSSSRARTGRTDVSTVLEPG